MCMIDSNENQSSTRRVKPYLVPGTIIQYPTHIIISTHIYCVNLLAAYKSMRIMCSEKIVPTVQAYSKTRVPAVLKH